MSGSPERVEDDDVVDIIEDEEAESLTKGRSCVQSLFDIPFLFRVSQIQLREADLQSKIVQMLSLTKIPSYPQPLNSKNILQDQLSICNLVIEAPTPYHVKKQAARMIVIRRIKMNRHKLKKLRKKMKFIWAKIRLRRATWREKVFLNEKMVQIKAAWKFDAKSHVAQLIRNVRDKPVPEPWIRPRMPESIIKEQLKIREEKKKKQFLSVLDERTQLT